MLTPCVWWAFAVHCFIHRQIVEVPVHNVYRQFQEDAHTFDQFLLLVDDEFATGEVRGNYILRLAEGQNVPGYQVWLVRNLVAYSMAFYDHTAPFPDAVIDPASEIWQRLKTGGSNVSQQFLAGIDSDEPWPAFSVPEPWLP